jgi:hypothetical protein
VIVEPRDASVPRRIRASRPELATPAHAHIWLVNVALPADTSANRSDWLTWTLGTGPTRYRQYAHMYHPRIYRCIVGRG